MRNALRTLPFILLLVSLLALPLVTVQSANDAVKANNLILVSPTDCPPTGCAAGQRLNFRAEFDLAPQFAGGANTQMCVYAPTPDWANAFSANLSGQVSGYAYQSGETSSVCSANAPAGYSFVGGAYGSLPLSAFADQLSFVLRINSSAASNGAILVRVFQVASDGNTWNQSAQLLRTFNVAATTATVYVANDGLACESYAPCFINSGDDLADGIGTGLKDAIDAQAFPRVINKSNSCEPYPDQ